MAKFTPLSNQELEALNPSFTCGKTHWKVEEAEDTTVKNGGNTGADMINLKLKVEDYSGVTRIIYTNLMFLPQMLWKTKHFCESAQLEEKYEEGSLEASDCLNKEGIGITKMGKAKNGYKARIEISDFIPFDEKEEKFKGDMNIPF